MIEDGYPYGEWEPAAGDIEAVARYVEAVWPLVSDADQRKLIDRAQAMFERYVEGFKAPGED